MIKVNYLFCITIAVLTNLFCFIPSYAVENDLGLWSAVNINAPITEKFQSKFQFSPRWVDNITDFNQFILHALLGYKFNKHFSFFQGYAWSTTYIPHFKREQRPYQELNFYHDVKKLSLEHRFRFEERFLQDIEGITLRGRYRLKGIYPLDKNRKWSLIAFDELFLNFNSHFGGPQRGIDQNRIYIGLNRRLNENVSLEGGYQLQQRFTSGPSNPYKQDLLNHFLVVYLNFSLPEMFHNHR